MKNEARMCRYVWVITYFDPAADTETEDAAIGVFESEESAKREYKRLMEDEERQEHTRYFIEYAPMFLDLEILNA